MLIFVLLFVGLLPCAFGEDTWTGVDRVVAVGDVHGDYDAFVAVLRAAEVIDSKGRWSGAKTHLVQTGDVLDRGPDSRKALDLLMSLEKQAAKAGGRVHALIGNHEAMNVYGDLRYSDPGEFAAFKTVDSARFRAALWEEQVKALASKPDEAYKKKWEDEHPLGWYEQRLAFSPKGEYGKWILSHNSVVKINDSLFVHGGIAPAYLSMSIGEMNKAILAELNNFSKLKPDGIVMGSDGPLWYRGLAQGTADLLTTHVDKVLETYGVKRIVIGHTPVPGLVVPRFGSKVLMIDAGMAAAYNMGRAALILENNEVYALHRTQRVKLPANMDDYVEYLKKALVDEPNPAGIQRLIKEAEDRQSK